jgi:F-type H+-transporting ATPase subunit epsilon
VAEFPARLVTPDKVLFEEEVEAVILRTGLGDATFLDGHSPLVGSVVPGLVRFVRPGGEEQRVAAHGGFVHVEASGRVTVLPPTAELAEDIDVERANRSLEAAEAELAELAAAGRTPVQADSETPETDVEVAQAEAARQRAETRIEVAGGAG